MNSPCCAHWYSTQEKEEAGSNYDIYTLPTLKKTDIKQKTITGKIS